MRTIKLFTTIAFTLSAFLLQAQFYSSFMLGATGKNVGGSNLVLFDKAEIDRNFFNTNRPRTVNWFCK